MMKSAGNKIGARTSLSSVNSSFPLRRWVSLSAPVLWALALSGCATRADLQQVQQDQREMRALLADQQVAVDGLRRRFEILRNEMSEKGRGKGGAPLPNDVAQRVSDLEARLALLEQGRVAEPGLSGVAPGSGVIKMPPVSVCHHVSEIGQRPSPTTW